MLSLDSLAWRQLNHAYGPATDTPQLIEQLALNAGPKADYQAEPWFTLWSSLCHQGDVYSASYAAVPHLVRICLDARGPIDFGFFLMPACVEIARVGGRGPEMPQQLSQAKPILMHCPSCMTAPIVMRHRSGTQRWRKASRRRWRRRRDKSNWPRLWPISTTKPWTVSSMEKSEPTDIPL